MCSKPPSSASHLDRDRTADVALEVEDTGSDLDALHHDGPARREDVIAKLIVMTLKCLPSRAHVANKGIRPGRMGASPGQFEIANLAHDKTGETAQFWRLHEGSIRGGRHPRDGCDVVQPRDAGSEINIEAETQGSID
ncbi:hypothetical protein LTR99_002670 [Exophiala xenobiotica]|uniref:Uncharacterized protein n=1 Tax=Vermiconidia calcicola TaxID=1690605 RepID=A0AAV9QFP6_9PEZI|nr:hypothetical protein LTR96_002911 [Exophiala xenobiotica]KAK5541993.1 hypothetical protein LTR25_001878 [Vermiconidia calcicola]KAK5306978.1 hypothetical protein LTR99_002670 [Exophiala xenobiotica]KAK5341047.1 hypothetical protein LTR98_001839 [Exophiala xenobiotica]KAK5433761.1 hypothetical protein LTR34_003273 [Exophiala xenobiotica]